MKKNISILAVVLFCTVGIFAKPKTGLIEAAKNGDYKKFEQLVKRGANLDEVNLSDLTVQCALAYFSDEDFEKACELLAKKKFDFSKPNEMGITLAYILSYSYSYNKLQTLLQYKPNLNYTDKNNKVTPICATQFGTFKYYSEQKIDDETIKKAEAVRKLLIENGSPEFEYLTMSPYYFGNLQFCLLASLRRMIPLLSIECFNEPEMFQFGNTNGQKWAAISKNGIKSLLKKFGLNDDIVEYTEPEQIRNALKKVAENKYAYILVAQTGNNSLCPYQWVVIQNFGELNPESKIRVYKPDSHYDFMEYQIKDISMLITIHVEREAE